MWYTQDTYTTVQLHLLTHIATFSNVSIIDVRGWKVGDGEGEMGVRGEYDGEDMWRWGECGW